MWTSRWTSWTAPSPARRSPKAPSLRRLSGLLACVLLACGSSRSADVIYLPSSADVVQQMLSLAQVGDSDVVFDLGCGDGRIVIAAVRERGAQGVCNDIDPARMAESRRNAEAAGVLDRIVVDQGDLFELDLHQGTVVALYLSQVLNVRLRPKLFRELRPGARIVSHNFDMGEWRPDSTATVTWPTGGTSAVHLWVLPADVAGTWEVEWADPAGSRTYRVRFEQAFQRLTGSSSHDGHAIELSGAGVRGDSLWFALADTLEGNPTLLHFSGRLAAGAIAGSVRLEGTKRAGRWRAARP
jgi:SAM-dependent methyltransferase